MDEENRSIKINHYFDITTPSRAKVKYNMLIDFKDGKVRITFPEIADTHGTRYTEFFDENGNTKKSKSVQKTIHTLENYISIFVDDFVLYLQKDNDWQYKPRLNKVGVFVLKYYLYRR